MWKKMMELHTLIGALGALIVAFAVSWVGVVHLGWRYVDLVGLAQLPFDASASIMAFSAIGAAVLIPIGCLAIEVKRYVQTQPQ